MAEEELKWFLKDAVVDKGLCTLCGACAAVCPYNIIEYGEEGPHIKEKCFRNGQGACKDVCHRLMTDAARISMNVFNFKAKPPTNLLGQYEKIVAARATDPAIRDSAQDGGAVTALLAYMFDNNLIDGAATVAGMAKPQSQVIMGKDELMATTGAKYAAVPVLSALRTSGLEPSRVAMVGLPCQVFGERRMQFFTGLKAHPPEHGTDGEKAFIPQFPYVIGLFCMENFRQDRLASCFSGAGIDPNDIKKYSIHTDSFTVETSKGEHVFSLKDLAGCVWEGCKMCRDATARVADISAGNTGSSSGWTTLILRNQKGLDLFNKAVEAGYLEMTDEVDTEYIEEFAGVKMRRFRKTLNKKLKDDEPLNFYWVRDYPGVRREVNGTNFVKIKSKSGLVDHDYMAKVAELAEKYGDGTLELTTRKSIEIQGVPGQNIDDIMADIYDSGIMTIGMGYAAACPGMAYCPEGLMYTKDIANKLTMMFAQRGMPHKLKVGVAGCPNSCVRVRGHDIGLMGQLKPKNDVEKCTGCGRCVEVCKYNALKIVDGKSVRDMDLCRNCGWCVRDCPHEAMVEEKRGFYLYIGANDARRPTQSILLRTFVTEEEIPPIVDKILKLLGKYRTQPGKQRLGNIIAQIGVGEFIRELNEE
jgi:coenzyme F420 hydrogenase subunit beta